MPEFEKWANPGFEDFLNGTNLLYQIDFSSIPKIKSLSVQQRFYTIEKLLKTIEKIPCIWYIRNICNKVYINPYKDAYV